jgi:hypothetical protein
MKTYGDLNQKPLDPETQMELGRSRMTAQPEIEAPVGSVPMNIGMAESQMMLNMPSMDPATGNQKRPIVKQFNPDAKLGSGVEGNQKQPINRSKSRK